MNSFFHEATGERTRPRGWDHSLSRTVSLFALLVLGVLFTTHATVAVARGIGRVQEERVKSADNDAIVATESSAVPSQDDDVEAVLSVAPLGKYDRLHWAYQPLDSSSPPTIRGTFRVANEIDLFVAANLEEQGLNFAPEASRSVLIRRVTFDLVGRPPHVDELDAFLRDRAPDAYPRLIDRLLSSPEYGMRWAQHWLDLARFAETDGFEHDKIRPEAYRYRDWVVQSLNDDLTYDRFISMQLAGDELYPGDQAAQIATGFCLAGPDMPDINSQQERQHHLLNELTGTVGAVFLGMQIGCAQCHDHMYDPISQGDFYRLRAVFEPSVSLKANRSVSFLDRVKRPEVKSHLMVRGDWQRPGPVVEPGFPRVANVTEAQIERSDGQPVVEGRRAALAEWLVDSRHPLTSRVMANRVWQHHFGRGLCETPSDFGLMGDSPDHGRLLDWLAGELMRNDWSLKQLHRTILLSRTYRQVSSLEDHASADERQSWNQTIAKDPENEYWSRFPRLRLEGEAIRDAMLYVSGKVNETMGGPGVRPPLPDELTTTLLKNQWEVDQQESAHARRSLYIFARRNLRYPIFEAFDRPDANASCPRRGQSTTATQSLLLLNSQETYRAAQAWAGELLRRASSDEARIQLAFRSAFSRSASPAEEQWLLSFLNHAQVSAASNPDATRSEELDAGADAPIHKRWTQLCLALLNTNEFVYLD